MRNNLLCTSINMQKFYVSSCQPFPRLSTVFADWFLVYLFHPQNISFCYTMSKKLKVLHLHIHSFTFFKDSYLVYDFHGQSISFCYNIGRNLMFLLVYFFHPCPLISLTVTMCNLFHGRNITFSYIIGRQGFSCLIFSRLSTFFMLRIFHSATPLIWI